MSNSRDAELGDNPVAVAGFALRAGILGGPRGLVSVSKAIIAIFRAGEPLWVVAATAWVSLSYLLRLSAVSAWIGLAVLFLPFLWRVLRRGYPGVRTPFDLAIALGVAGGVVGLLRAPDFGRSLGAFQSLLAATLAYYSIANYRRPENLIKWGLPLLAIVLLVITFFALSKGPLPQAEANSLSSRFFELARYVPKLPQTLSQRNLAPGLSHGLALSLLVIATTGVGFAIFGRSRRVRVVSAVGSALLVTVALVFTSNSVSKLFTGASLADRMPIWRETWRMLQDHPLTGLGLGVWPYLTKSGSTHVHNAYLELYANAGVLGALAFVVALAIGIKLLWQMLRSAPANPWYGLGVGALLASLVSALVGLVESAPVGFAVRGSGAFLYVVSPLPWILLCLMVVAHRLLKEES